MDRMVIARESRKRMREEEEDVKLCVILAGFIIMVVGAWHCSKYRLKEVAWREEERFRRRKDWMDSLMNDRVCREQLRLDRRCFDKLCHVLLSKGGLVTTRNVTVREIVAIFLHILGHDLKNRTIGSVFYRSGATVSRHFHAVLRAMMKIGKYYIKLNSNVSYSQDNRWKWFEGAVGALDGMHIKMIVPLEDRPRYRGRKGDITTNVLASCDPNLQFSYVLPGWEGTASDPRILADALRRPNGLKLPINKYFLVDLGYNNAPGFLAPYKGTRYHLDLGRGNTPTNYMELFNLRHSSALNTIERAFGLLKKRWSILRHGSFFDKKTQVRIINACFILHNFLRREKMDEEDLLASVDVDLENEVGYDVVKPQEEYFVAASRMTPEWNNFRDELAKNMFNEYLCQRSNV